MNAIRCREAQEAFGSLIDGHISDSERETVNAHLDECPACMREFAETVHLLALCRFRSDATATDCDLSLKRIWRHIEKDLHPRQLSLVTRLVTFAAAAALIILGTGYLVYLDRPSSDPFQLAKEVPSPAPGETYPAAPMPSPTPEAVSSPAPVSSPPAEAVPPPALTAPPSPPGVASSSSAMDALMKAGEEQARHVAAPPHPEPQPPLSPLPEAPSSACSWKIAVVDKKFEGTPEPSAPPVSEPPAPVAPEGSEPSTKSSSSSLTQNSGGSPAGAGNEGLGPLMSGRLGKAGSPKPQVAYKPDQARQAIANDSEKTVGSRSFLLKQGRWYQEGYSDQTTTLITRGSRDYKRLAKSISDLPLISKLGDEVVFTHGGKWYRLTGAGN